MRVLHITNAFPTSSYGSFGIFIKEQVDSLTKVGIKNDIVFINAYQNNYLEYLKKIQEIRKYNNIDLVHCHHQYSAIPMLLSGIDKPKILSVLGDVRKQNFLHKFVLNAVSIKFQKVIYKYEFNYANDRFIYLPNGVDINLFKPIDKKKARKVLGLAADKTYILFVSASGTENPVKRYDLFIQIVRKLRMNNSNIEELILSQVNRSLVPYYFNAADLLLVTSDHEGSPNSVKEAMACNLPVVSRDVGNVRDLFGNLKGYLLLNNLDISHIVNSINSALSVKNVLGRNRIIEIGLDRETVARKLKYLYEKVIQSY